MTCPKGVVGFSLPLLFLPILAISIWPTVFGRITEEERKQIAEHGLCTDPNIVHSYDYCYPNCANREPGQCDSRGDKAGLTCQCKPGYILDRPRFYSPEPGTRFWDTKARCIKLEECPKVPCEQIANAELLHCGDRNYSQCHTTCANPEPVCDGFKDCAPRCQCKEGYTWDRPYRMGGKCIKLEDCHSRDVPQRSADCEDPNIVYKYISCHGRKCNPSCKYPNAFKACGDWCKMPALLYCMCRDGYVSEKEDGMGKCVKLEECPKEEEEAKLCMPDEEYTSSCGDRNCSTKDVAPLSLGPLGHEPGLGCPKRCACKPGYLRLEPDEACVREEECPEEDGHECGESEEFKVDCQEERSCRHRYFPVDKAGSEQPCTAPAQCHCKEGYVRREEDSVCVREELCPILCHDPNEQRQLVCKPDHGQICGQPPAMAVFCFYRPGLCPCTANVNRCVCKPGYARNGSDGPCVKQEECPARTCPANEELNSRCFEVRCIDKDKKHHNPSACKPFQSCQCKEGYVRRGRHGPCVKEEECPRFCPSGELYVQSCWDQTCEDKDEPNPYPNNGAPGPACGSICTCKEGEVRREKGGPCVREEDCPGEEACASPDEERLLICPGYKEPSCNGPKEQLANCASLQPRCVCKQGLLRVAANGQGPCVSSCAKRGI